MSSVLSDVAVVSVAVPHEGQLWWILTYLNTKCQFQIRTHWTQWCSLRQCSKCWCHRGFPCCILKLLHLTCKNFLIVFTVSHCIQQMNTSTHCWLDCAAKWCQDSVWVDEVWGETASDCCCCCCYKVRRRLMRMRCGRRTTRRRRHSRTRTQQLYRRELHCSQWQDSHHRQLQRHSMPRSAALLSLHSQVLHSVCLSVCLSLCTLAMNTLQISCYSCSHSAGMKGWVLQVLSSRRRLWCLCARLAEPLHCCVVYDTCAHTHMSNMLV